jgi:hypothetical protein
MQILYLYIELLFETLKHMSFILAEQWLAHAKNILPYADGLINASVNIIKL